MRRNTNRRRRQAALLGSCALLLGGCGLQSGGTVPLQVGPGSIRPVPALEGATITVGSKEFTEQVILGYMIEFALSAAGADVRDLTNIQGSNSVHEALKNGQVDVYFEYTGTGWINYLKNEKPIPDATKQFEAVRDADAKNGLVWVNPAPMDNTYALAMNSQTAKDTGVRTISDYAALVKKDPTLAQTCLETEFTSRQDGFPGMAAAYGFDPATVPTTTLQTGIIFAATAGGQCKFGEVTTTDGRNLGLGLQLLTDDKQFFPRYNATLLMRASVAEQYPEIATVLKPLSDALTSEEITQLNAKVDVEGQDPAEVARQWMVKQGFVSVR